MAEILPYLSSRELETLLIALDPLLDGFGGGESCLDDASAYLVRLGEQIEDISQDELVALMEWINIWRATGGNRNTLRLMVKTLLSLNKTHKQIATSGEIKS